MSIGSEGLIRVREHFPVIVVTTVGASGGIIGFNGLIYGSINEGSFAATVDEPGGVLAVVTDTADNDNAVVYTEAKFKPADGGIAMEARVKLASITTGAVFVGFTETMSKASPVMPLEFATATMAYNGSGGIVGLVFDPDGTDPDDWRAGAGDAGVVASGADANGTAASGVGLGLSTMVADKWDVIRVEIDVAGDGYVYLAQDSGSFKLVKKIAGAVTATDLFYPCVMVENRGSAACTLEIDYFNVDANIDWTQ